MDDFSWNHPWILSFFLVCGPFWVIMFFAYARLWWFCGGKQDVYKVAAAIRALAPSGGEGEGKE